VLFVIVGAKGYECKDLKNFKMKIFMNEYVHKQMVRTTDIFSQPTFVMTSVLLARQ